MGGLDSDLILKKAQAAGAVPEGHELSRQEILDLVFEPGFSTAEKVTNISGRGVGMDVVKRMVERLGGSVNIESAPGKGTEITLRLPRLAGRRPNRREDPTRSIGRKEMKSHARVLIVLALAVGFVGCHARKAKDEAPTVINESDFIEGEYELFDDVEGPKEGTKPWYEMQLGLRDVPFDKGSSKAVLKAAYESLDA